jgi:hypothetical protein
VRVKGEQPGLCGEVVSARSEPVRLGRKDDRAVELATMTLLRLSDEQGESGLPG